MIDLHSHLLPGIDDGAVDVATAVEMARIFVADGVSHVACTPHILPGVYHNSGPQIRAAIANLQTILDDRGIALQLVTGADNHIVSDFVADLHSGHLLTLADTRYVLVEPPHHVAPPRLEDLFFNIMLGGYVPILTHPERLTWVRPQYHVIRRLAEAGVWMQITAGSLSGRFGKEPRYLAEKMLDDGIVHILATDAHDPKRRPPLLSEGYLCAEKRVGQKEAVHLVLNRPMGILADEAPQNMPTPSPELSPETIATNARRKSGGNHNQQSKKASMLHRLRKFLG